MVFPTAVAWFWYVVIGIGVFALGLVITKAVFRIDDIVALLRQIAEQTRPNKHHVPGLADAKERGRLPGEIEITQDNLGAAVARVGTGVARGTPDSVVEMPPGPKDTGLAP